MKSRKHWGSGFEMEEEKDIIWYALRIGFGLMCLLFTLNLFVNFLIINQISGILFLILMPFNLFVSIIHLFYHREKSFAIIVFLFSILFILLFGGILFPPTACV